MLALAACGVLDCPAQTPEGLRAMIDRGEAAQAYEAARRTPDRLGDPAFDLVFGIAAVHSGHASEGVLALERFLLRFPDHDVARVELARGYYLVGEDARAREEFELALTRNPAPQLARVIGDYLAAIRARESRYKPTATFYVEAGGGYDSNPRAGVDNPTISLPIFGEVTVPDNGVRQADRAAQYGAGFRVTGPVASRVAAFASGQADIVRYPKVTDFNQNVYAGSVGLLGQWRTQSWRAGAARGYQTLDAKPYRHTSGVFLDWAAPINERLAISAGAQYGKFEYEGGNSVRDSDFQTFSIALRRAFAVAWQPTLELSANAGRERNVHDDRQDLSRDLYGGRLGVSVAPFGDWTLGAGALYQRSRYHEPDPTLETTRLDRYAAGDVNLAWNPIRGFTLRAEFSDARNESNLALYEYRRRTALIRGRYEFR